ncbi:MAG: type II toxin-antitoxin system RelE/ParE family toxin [Deferrisomatales bacterium]
MRPVTFHPAAQAEVVEAAQYYEEQSPGLGPALIREVERAVEQLAAGPETAPRIGRRVRRKLLHRFPYSLVFAVYPDRLRIVAVAHQKRRPRYWHKRLAELPR